MEQVTIAQYIIDHMDEIASNPGAADTRFLAAQMLPADATKDELRKMAHELNLWAFAYVKKFAGA